MNDAATTPPTKTHTLTLTRGAAYLIEGLCQDFTNATNPSRIVKMGRMWDKFRKANPRTIYPSWKPEGTDFELPAVTALDASLSDLEASKRINEQNVLYSKWQDETISMDIRDKERDLLREIVSKAIENKKIAHRNALGSNSNHTLIVLEQLGFADDE